MKSHFLPEAKAWFLDWDGQPIIHLMAPRPNSGRLNPGGLRYDPAFFGPNDEPMRLPDEFVALGRCDLSTD